MTVSAAALLRDARRSGGLTQSEVAARARVTQSVVSAYESGRREPTLAMLEKLVSATGHELRLTVEPAAQGALHRRVLEHLADVRAVLGEAGLTNPRLFGSAARGTDTAHSDVDILVDLPPHVGLVTLMCAEEQIADILGVPVDLVPAADIKPDLRADVFREALPL